MGHDMGHILVCTHYPFATSSSVTSKPIPSSHLVRTGGECLEDIDAPVSRGTVKHEAHPVAAMPPPPPSQHSSFSTPRHVAACAAGGMRRASAGVCYRLHNSARVGGDRVKDGYPGQETCLWGGGLLRVAASLSGSGAFA